MENNNPPISSDDVEKLFREMADRFKGLKETNPGKYAEMLEKQIASLEKFNSAAEDLLRAIEN